jgi:hypothetical protein
LSHPPRPGEAEPGTMLDQCVERLAGFALLMA